MYLLLVLSATSSIYLLHLLMRLIPTVIKYIATKNVTRRLSAVNNSQSFTTFSQLLAKKKSNQYSNYYTSGHVARFVVIKKETHWFKTKRHRCLELCMFGLTYRCVVNHFQQEASFRINQLITFVFAVWLYLSPMKEIFFALQKYI